MAGKKKNSGKSSRSVGTAPSTGEASVAPEVSDKSSVVAGAVVDQLRASGRDLDMDKVMGDDYGYDFQSMMTFLSLVLDRLWRNNPPYYFSFDQAFARGALTMKLGKLIRNVDDATADAPRPGWRHP